MRVRVRMRMRMRVRIRVRVRMVGQNTVPLLLISLRPFPQIQGRYIARLPTYCIRGGDEGESDGDGDG